MAQFVFMGDWFETWFDSEYYHLLYNNRSHEEAREFINNLDERLPLPKGSRVLDLACGKGRHAMQLNELGYDVCGVDLSPNSIQFASQFGKEGLCFEVQDMRTLSLSTTFDAVFNLFTSFGYFDAESDNLRVLEGVHQHLKAGGWFVLDFMNAFYIESGLVAEEVQVRRNVQFNIRRWCDKKHFYKEINISETGQTFTERVQYLPAGRLKTMLESSGFKVMDHFGNYQLSPFSEEGSSRCIYICKRK